MGWAYQEGAFSDEDVDRYIENMRKPGVTHAAINYYRATFRNRKKQMRGLTKPVTVPTHMIWGENDKALGKELSVGTERFFDAPFSINYLKDCSHWVASEYPDQVNQWILDFFLPKTETQALET